MIIEYASFADLQQALNESRDRTLAYFDLSSEQLRLTYAPGKWTIKALLHHLADAETVLYERIRRGIANPGQVVYGFNQDAWAEELHYDQRPLTLNQQLYQVTRAAVIDLAERYYDSHGQQKYVHNQTGLRNVTDEFHKVAWHNLHHLQQIEKALANGHP